MKIILKDVMIDVVIILIACGPALAQRAMTVDDLWAIKRIGEAVLSPDGKYLAFAVEAYDMEKNSGNTDIWMVSVDDKDLRRLTYDPEYDGTPRWKTDGSALAFISSRDGSRQIYILPMNGGEAIRVTDFPVDVEDFIWSPDGEHFAFTASVFADAKDLRESAERVKKREDSKVQARIIDGLLYRVWDHWTEGMRSHVFVCSTEGKDVVDVTPGEYDTPPVDLDGSQDFCFSPDGKEIAFVRNPDPMVAISTNNDVFITSIKNGSLQCITGANRAVDNQPSYSPDGRYIAYKAMRRPGFEADRYEIMLYDRAAGKARSVTSTLDLTVRETIWSPDSRHIYFTAPNQGRNSIFVVDVTDAKSTELVHDHGNSNILLSPDGRTLFFKQEAVDRPNDIFKMDLANGDISRITFLNKPLLDQLVLFPAEDFWFKSFDGRKAHGLLIKPPFFDPNKKYPFIYIIHGGPQGMSADGFHYRWNLSLFAAFGYVVATVNFRGSMGYGQDWCDAVSKNWGGGPYKDLMSGLDYLLKTNAYIDRNRLAAAGASYGGFMINWIATQTDRFAALVSHAGVFDQRSMYGATEELWFPEWEFNGTPYGKPEFYEKWSPSYFIDNFKKYKTPTLVIHGEHDYRVPFTQGMQMFTALQRLGVPSRFIYFPDETHFVQKPRNARLWWNEVHAWIKKWLEQ